MIRRIDISFQYVTPKTKHAVKSTLPVLPYILISALLRLSFSQMCMRWLAPAKRQLLKRKLWFVNRDSPDPNCSARLTRVNWFNSQTLHRFLNRIKLPKTCDDHRGLVKVKFMTPFTGLGSNPSKIWTCYFRKFFALDRIRGSPLFSTCFILLLISCWTSWYLRNNSLPLRLFKVIFVETWVNQLDACSCRWDVTLHKESGVMICVSPTENN